MEELVVAERSELDTETPSVARVYDAALGGRDNFAVDRAALASIVERAPEYLDVVRENRAWQQRALRWLAEDAGVEQFLDLGCGLPTRQNTHEVVQVVNPDARVVYIDNDPAVAAFGRALLEDDDRTRFAALDLTDPDVILAHPTVTGHLDLTRPVGLVLGATMHFVQDDDRAQRIMRTYIDALAAGSYVAMSHGFQPAPDDPISTTMAEFLDRYAAATLHMKPRTNDGLLALLPGLELVPPGLVAVDEWWPSGPRLRPRSPAVALGRGVVARKP